MLGEKCEISVRRDSSMEQAGKWLTWLIRIWRIPLAHEEQQVEAPVGEPLARQLGLVNGGAVQVAPRCHGRAVLRPSKAVGTAVERHSGRGEIRILRNFVEP